MTLVVGASEGWGWVLFVIAMSVILLLFIRDVMPFRLGDRKIVCPKCQEFVRPTPRESPKGEAGGDCPDCGEWFPLSTWEQMADPGAC